VVERAKPKARAFCSHDAWYELVEAMNQQKEVVRVSRESLEEVEECHANKAGHYLDRLARAPGRRIVMVDRIRLWKLIQDHGEICGN